MVQSLLLGGQLKMSDKEKLSLLLTSFGIEDVKETESSIIIPEGDGYCCFFVEFKFNGNGKFTSHGVFE